MRARHLALFVPLAALLAWRGASFTGEPVEFAYMALGVVLFVGLQAVLLALRVDDGVRVVFGYLATFYFGNRLLAEVWLGSEAELSSGTVAPLLLGDLVLVEILLRRRVRLPAAILPLAVGLIVPVVSLLNLPDASFPAFLYQYGSILRLPVVAASLVWLARRTETPRRTAEKYVVAAALTMAGIGLLTGAVALVTEQRFGLPGWGQNVYANGLALVGAYCGWRLITGARPRWRYVAFVIGCGFGILGTGTRLALVALGVALLWPLVARLFARSMTLFANTAVGLVGAALFAGFTGPLLLVAAELNPRLATIGGLQVTAEADIADVLDAAQRESSFRTRQVLWSASLNMAGERPVAGVGWGQWNWQKSRYGAEFEVMLDPHNGLMWALAEGGILGVALTYGALVVVLLSLPMSSAAMTVLLALLLEGMNANMQKPLFAVLLAVFLARAWLERGRGTALIRRRPR